MSGGLFAGLPEVFSALCGDIERRMTAEPLATCGDCAMKPRPGIPEGVPWAPVFVARSRCCTYHPSLPCFAVGRALRRGGEGAERIRARIRERSGVLPGGILASDAYRAHRSAPGVEFGQDDGLVCPYWSEARPEGRGCTIHLDREAVCRTWHCRLAHGGRAHRTWMALKDLLFCIESTLVDECVHHGSPPDEEASAEAWEAWYLGCADRIDALGEGDLARLRGARLEAMISKVQAAAAARDAALPEVVSPSIRSWDVHASGVSLSAWSAFDPVEAPPWIFHFLSKLDGKRSWREARAETEAELGQPVGDDLVMTLYRRGLVGPPEYVDVGPGMSVFPSREGE